MAMKRIDVGSDAAYAERISRWPKGVRAMTIFETSLLGLNEKTKQIYWDGKPIVTRKILQLKWYERILATVVAGSSLGIFILELMTRWS